VSSRANDLVEDEDEDASSPAGARENPGELDDAEASAGALVPLTAEAQDIISKADDGGIPMFKSANLERIARENGVPVTADMTPNEIIDELRRRA